MDDSYAASVAQLYGALTDGLDEKTALGMADDSYEKDGVARPEMDGNTQRYGYGEVTLNSMIAIIGRLKALAKLQPSPSGGSSDPVLASVQRPLPLAPGGSSEFTFLDIGSGLGKPSFAAAMLWPERFTRCVGIEYLSGLHDVACSLKEKWTSTTGPALSSLMAAQTFESTEGPAAGPVPASCKPAVIDFLNGDALQLDWSDADVIFMNCVLFDEPLRLGLAERTDLCKPGTVCVTTLHRLPSPQWQVVDTFKAPFSWCPNTAEGVAIMVHVKRSDFGRWSAAHGPQLTSLCNIPEPLWPELQDIVVRKRFEAGRLIQFVLNCTEAASDDDEGGGEAEEDPGTLAVAATAPLVADSPQAMFLVDHAWSFESLVDAANSLAMVPGLWERTSALADPAGTSGGDVVEPEPELELEGAGAGGGGGQKRKVERIAARMEVAGYVERLSKGESGAVLKTDEEEGVERLSRAVSILLPLSRRGCIGVYQATLNADCPPKTVFFVPDEVGCRIRRSDSEDPNVVLDTFFDLDEHQAFCVARCISDVDEDEMLLAAMPKLPATAAPAASVADAVDSFPELSGTVLGMLFQNPAGDGGPAGSNTIMREMAEFQLRQDQLRQAKYEPPPPRPEAAEAAALNSVD